MEWDEYTIKARKRNKGANQKLEILSVTMNGNPFTKRPEINDRPNFGVDAEPPTLVADCVYVGGTEENRCRWVWGMWW